MTARELAEKILNLPNPDIPVVLIESRMGTQVRFADPVGTLAEVTVFREEERCSLPPGDHEVLVLGSKGEPDGV